MAVNLHPSHIKGHSTDLIAFRVAMLRELYNTNSTSCSLASKREDRTRSSAIVPDDTNNHERVKDAEDDSDVAMLDGDLDTAKYRKSV